MAIGSCTPADLPRPPAAENHEGAKIYAQNAIRKKAEALNYLRLASRLDAVVSRLDTQAKMQVRGGVSHRRGRPARLVPVNSRVCARRRSSTRAWSASSSRWTRR